MTVESHKYDYENQVHSRHTHTKSLIHSDRDTRNFPKMWYAYHQWYAKGFKEVSGGK
jgi:hypothetical protein